MTAMEKLLVYESISTLTLNKGPKALNFAPEQLLLLRLW